MLDTNMVSYILKGKSEAARTKLASLQRHEVACISSITEAEILYGMAKSAISGERKRAVEGFMAKIEVLPWGREEALAYGALRAKLESTGRILGNLDLLIAAHAVSVRATMITADKAFRQVKDIRSVANWASDLGK